jgi:single-strand DNA-binding protein
MGRDAEIRSTGSGMNIANFSIGVSDREKVNGEWKDVTEWVNCVAFGKLAEVLRDYAGKGAKVYVSGKLKTRSWEKDGVTKYRTEIVVNELVLLSDRKDRPRQEEHEPPAVEPITDSDIPF